MDTLAPIPVLKPIPLTLRQRQWEMFKLFVRRLWRSPSARIGGILVIFMVTTAIAVPIFDNKYDPTRDTSLTAKYTPPDCVYRWVVSNINGTSEDNLAWSKMTCEYPFGADKLGRSIFRRVGHGMFASLWVSLFSVFIALSIGASIGLVAGYLGGLFDSIFMRIMDVILAFPSLLLAIILVTIFGAGLTKGMIAIAITQIPRYARLARSMSISIRNQDYILAARSIGTGDGSILVNHVLPNSLAPLIVQASLGLGTAVIETAALGFLGLGQQPPYPELGKMLAESREALVAGNWWIMFFPSITIIMIVLGFNLFGDGMRDVLDPRLKK